VAGRGSPVDAAHERRHLPTLCGWNFWIVSWLRMASFALGLTVLLQIRALCESEIVDDGNSATNSNFTSTSGSPASCGDGVASGGLLCGTGKQTAVLLISIATYSHVLGVALAALLTGTLVCRHSSSTVQRIHRWCVLLALFRPAALLRGAMTRRSNKKSSTGDENDDGSTNNQENETTHNSSSSSNWWHCLCRFCCVCTSVSTCCLLGGSELFWSSKDSATTNGTDSNVLSEISTILADFFDSGNVQLDVTPTDFMVGLHVLAAQQQEQRNQRTELLQREMRQEAQYERELSCHDDADLLQQDEVGIEVSLSWIDEVGDKEDNKCVIQSRSVAAGSFDVDVVNTSEDSTPSDVERNRGDNDSDDKRENATSASPTRSLLVSGDRLKVRSVKELQLHRHSMEDRAYYRVARRTRLSRCNDFDCRVIQDGAYYMRLSLAVYGHILYLYHNTCSAPCCLLARMCTVHGGGQRTREAAADGSPTSETVVVGDNRCGCNEAALRRIADLNVDDIVYVSFKSGIRICPYGVLIDRKKRSIVVVIRGTLSLESTAIDLNIEPVSMKECCRGRDENLAKSVQPGDYCHSGMMQCALWIYDDLKSRNILENLMLVSGAKYADFRLVLTGHSLGAGVAAILGFMFRSQIHDVACLCYGPPGCAMSERLARQDFITSYVLNSDIIPRMSLQSVAGLRNDVLTMIARIKVPKREALRFNYAKGKNVLVLLHDPDQIPESDYYSRLKEFTKHKEKSGSLRDQVQLCMPGARIVHLVNHVVAPQKTEAGSTTTPLWAEQKDFGEIEITSSLFLDHDPKRMLDRLDNVAKYF
jgi:Lipase (class 3)